MMKIVANTPPKVVDVVTAVEALKDKVEAQLHGNADVVVGSTGPARVPMSISSAQPAQKSEAVVGTAGSTAVVTAPHVSWLKKVGHFFGSILKFVVNDEQKVATLVTPALEMAFPQFAPLIAAGDALASRITKVVLSVEAAATAVGSATSGTDKLNAALAQANPVIDSWVAAAFPGSKPLSSAGRTALVNAFVTVANEVEADVVPPPAK